MTCSSLLVESPVVPLLPQKLLFLLSGDVPPNEHPRKLYTKHRRSGSICVEPSSPREKERERENIPGLRLPSTERKSVVLSPKGSFSLPSLNRVGKWLFSLAAYTRTLRPRKKKEGKRRGRGRKGRREKETREETKKKRKKKVKKRRGRKEDARRK